MICLSKPQVLFLHQELVRDGNKRTGAHVMLVFLALNGIELEYTQQELVDIILAAAAGTKGLDDLHQWILDHS